MSRRVENVFNIRLRAGQVRSVEVLTPERVRGVQIVIERAPFEHLPKNEAIGKVRMFAGRVKLGGSGFSGGIADFTNIRPGRIGLWTRSLRPVLVPTDSIRIEFTAIRDFALLAHLDIIT